MSKQPNQAPTAEISGAEVVRGGVHLFGATFISAVISVVFASYIARTFPPKDLAILPVWSMVWGFGICLAGLGLGAPALRLIPPRLAAGEQAEAARLMKTVLALSLAGSSLVALALFVWARPLAALFLKDAERAFVFRGLAPAMLLQAMGLPTANLLRAMGRFSQLSLIQLVVLGSSTALNAFGYMLWGIPGLLVALTIPPLVGVLWAGVVLWPHLRRHPGFYPAAGLLKDNWPYYGESLSNMAYNRADVVLLGVLTRPERVATYYIALQLANMVQQLWIAQLDSALPALAQRGREGPERLRRSCARATRYLFLALAPLHLLLAALAPAVVAIYTGGHYPEAGPILRVLALVLFVDGFRKLHRSLLVVVGRAGQCLFLQVFAAVLGLGLTAVLVQRYAGLGAAWAWGLTALVLLVVSALFLRSTGVLAYEWGMVWRSSAIGLASAGAMGCLAVWVRAPLSGLFLGLAGASLYLLLMLPSLHLPDVELVMRLLPERVRTNKFGQRVEALLTEGVRRARGGASALAGKQPAGS